MMVTPEQFRESYTFLAPTDYDANFADVLIPASATEVLIDGMAVTATEEVAPGWMLARVPLGGTAGGAHVLTADVPVGLQVMGFGHATSYYYPGGLNLKVIYFYKHRVRTGVETTETRPKIVWARNNKLGGVLSPRGIRLTRVGARR